MPIPDPTDTTPPLADSPVSNLGEEQVRARSGLDFPVVGIGASAGGIAALRQLFEHMPSQPGMAFVVIVHLSPHHESSIDSILGKVTSMPVQQVTHRVPIKVDHVYLISPSLQLSMDDGHLEVSKLERPVGRHVAIDIFFRTLGEVHRDRAISIVLSGTGSDGTLGIARVKECGGVVIVQSPGDAEYDGMPQSAIASGEVDFVLPAHDMAAKLVALWHNARQIELPFAAEVELHAEAPSTAHDRAAAEAALGDILVMLRVRTGHDFRHYKRATVLRRVERRLQVNALPTLPAYRKHLETHVDETGALLKDMLISVTNFFRDPEGFEALERSLGAIVTEPGPERSRLRSWVVGCATGEEAYSIGMLLTEKTQALQHPLDIQVFATDIDERAIALGRAGSFAESIAADVPAARLREFFTKEQGRFRVRKDLRERILFSTHNVLHDPPFSRLELISCRNLLIYLDRDVQAQVLEVFHFALQPGGLLFLGSSETADAAPGLFVPVDKKNRIYRADPSARRSHLGFQVTSVRHRPPTPAAGPGSAAPRTALNDMHQRMLQQYAPPSVLLDANSNIVHSTARAGRYLQFADGQPTQNLLSVIRAEMRIATRTAVFEAWKSGKCVASRRIPLSRDGSTAWLMVSACPLIDGDSTFMLVTFHEVALILEPGPDAGPDPTMLALQDELDRLRDQLQRSDGQSATSTEELRAANEELQAINEELRSTTEELETSKEELQSVNEELITVNYELKSKIEETGKVNDDLKNLMSSTDIATVFVDRHMRIKRYTPRASELFNLIGPDVGRSLMDITHRLRYDTLEEDAMAAFESLRTVEREVASSDGRTYLVRMLPYRTNEDVIDGAVLNFVDITATRLAEARQRSLEAKMRLVVENTADYAIMTLDLQGLVTTWNKGAENIFGYSEAEIVGQSGALLFTPEDRAAGAPQEEMRHARQHGRAPDERWHRRKDGSVFYCSGVMMPVHESQTLVGYAKIARDLTELKHSEAQREALLSAEKAAQAEMHAASELKDQFLAVMSHELKHPLNLILVNADLLVRMPEVRDAPAVARAAGIIRRTVLGQAQIIDDLLDLSRLHTGKLTLNRGPMEWSAVIERVLGAVSADAEHGHLTLDVHLDPNASLIDADAVRVEQIVWNLVSNALKFTPPGGTIKMRLNAEGRFARLDVIDTGQGIDPDFVGHVFDMFRQAERAATRQQGGLGIGLALVKHLAEQHGGRVAAFSEGRNKGSCFSIWLPLEGGEAHPSAYNEPLPALDGLRILLVDDTPDTLEAFGMLLRIEGALVTAAGGGAEALRAFAPADFDVVLSDIAMPGMDGYQLMRELRKLPGADRVVTVALTGFGRRADEDLALDAGFNAHVSKPVRIETLLKTLRRFSVLRR
jgi:two-component system CheB/CheR fusion protein